MLRDLGILPIICPRALSDEEVLAKLAVEKGGKVDESETKIAEERIKYAKVWLANYAPDDYKFEMTKEIPASARKLTPGQIEYLKEVAKLFDDKINADSLQTALYDLSKRLKVKPGEAFAAIYLTFIGKTHGPRAGILLYNFGKDKVIDRINDIMKEGDK